MTDAFTCHVPITAEMYARIKDGLGPQIPPGMIAHRAYRTEAGLRYVDVWQTKNDFDAFEHGRLHSVVHPLLQDMLGFVPPEPPKTALDIVNAWTAEHAQIARHPVTHAIGKLPNGSSSPHSVTNSPPPNDGARAALPIRSER